MLSYPGAYVDPTSGGLLLQLLFGGSAALLIGMRLLRARVKALVFNRKRRLPEA
jgi:hypothetical protein